MSQKSACLVLTLIALVCAAGCSADSDEDLDGAARAKARRDRMEQLRALPYLAFSAETNDRGRRGLTTFNEELSYPGYNLYINQFLCTAELIDRRGKVVHSWSHAPCHHWENGKLLPNGDFVVTGLGPINWDQFGDQHMEKRYLLRLGWEGQVIWKKPITAHHDVDLTPDNRLITLTMGYRREASVHRGIDIRDNYLTILDDDGQVLEEASLFDILTGEGAEFQLQKAGLKLKRKMREMDLFHTNSVEWIDRPNLIGRHPIYSPDNVIITSRNQDCLAVIDWKRRKLVWSWGRGEIFGPHDATVLESGNVLVLDNGLGRGWSRAIEVDPITEKIVWEYRAPNPEDFYTRSRGGNQRLPNGNTLITNSNHGQAFEVTAGGRTVWDYYNPNSDENGRRATIFRMERYETDYIDRIRDQFKD